MIILGKAETEENRHNGMAGISGNIKSKVCKLIGIGIGLGRSAAG